MIENDAQLDQALEHMASMYRALASLRQTVQPAGPAWFGVMTEGPLDELRRLEADVADYTGRLAAERAGADLWLRLTGANLVWPEAPSSVLSSLIDTVRKGVQAAAEWLQTRELSTRPTQALKRACDLRVAALQPGSLQVGLRLPDVEGDDDLPETVAEALQAYASVAGWAASEDSLETLEETVRDPELRRVLLAEVKRLLPAPRGDVESIEISGRAVTRQGVRLTRQAHTRLDLAVDAAAQEQVETQTGDLREIDLDHLSFTLRNVADGLFDLSCEFPPELLDTAIEALDRRVEVRVVRRAEGGRGGHRQRVQVLRLAILEDEDVEHV